MAKNSHPKSGFSASIGAGVSSIFNPKGRTYFILEHKNNSRYHRAGENQEIIVDKIEIGRDSHCQVRFDESFNTVSRHHVAIVRENDYWKLIRLSKTNPTFVNGNPVQDSWFLQNGDEIQLSIGGPKLGFIVPQGKNSVVSSIGLSRRLSLFRQQALRPYKNALAVMSAILLLALLVGSYKLYEIHQKNMELDNLVAQSLEEQRMLRATNDSIAQEIVNKTEAIDDMQEQIRTLKSNAGKISANHHRPNVGSVNNDALRACDKNVYFILSIGYEIVEPNGESFEIECGSGDDNFPVWSGTGFLLDDGRFVTARHVVEPWFFINPNNSSDAELLALNVIANNGGKVIAHIVAISNTGEYFEFTSNQFRTNRSNDEKYRSDDGEIIVLSPNNGPDWAYVHVGKPGGLPFNSEMSRHLERGTRLAILGFPLGLGANSVDDISPVYGSAVVAADGLQKGFILTTETTYEHGCSGGPVFYTDPQGRLVVIGITSAIAGRSTGFVQPISSIN